MCTVIPQWQQQTLHGYRTVWFYPKEITNILSLSQFIITWVWCEVQYFGRNFLKTTKHDGTTRIFKESDTGLYYLDTSPSQTVLLIKTVDDNQVKYTKQLFLCSTGLEHTKDGKTTKPKAFINIIDRNQLSIISQDIRVVDDIFGKEGSWVNKRQNEKYPWCCQHENHTCHMQYAYHDVKFGGDIIVYFFVTV